MPVTTIDVLDKDGVARTVNAPSDPGRAAAAAAKPVAMCTEDKAVIDALAADADTIAAAIAGGKMKATSADGDDAALGAKADAAATTDAGTFSLIALFKRLLERVTTLVKAPGQAAMAASHPVVIASDQTAVAVKTGQIVVSQEITRPSDTTAYVINDVVGPTGGAAVGVLTDFFSANGASGFIAKVELETDQAANATPFRIYFFHTAPTAIADNAAFALLYADVAKRIGYVDIGNMSQEGSGSTGAAGYWTGQLAAKAAAADNDLYYVIVAKAAFTPASAQKFTVKVTNDSNG